jgi:hypothetical protein
LAARSTVPPARSWFIAPKANKAGLNAATAFMSFLRVDLSHFGEFTRTLPSRGIGIENKRYQ